MKDLFAKIDLFEGLDNKVLTQVAEAAIMRRFGTGEVIVQQGQTGLGMYIVVRGSVKVLHKLGATERELAVLGPEQVFAEMSVLDDKPRSATVVSAEDTECLLLTRDSFVKLMNKHPEIPIRVAVTLANRLRKANEQGDAQAAPSAASAAPGAATSPAKKAPNGDGQTESSAPAPSSNGGSRKAQVQSQLLSFFENLYTVKAITRFSVAILGCPVEARGSDILYQASAGDVKAVILPAGRAVEMKIEASRRGQFALHVFTPGSPSPQRFDAQPISPSEEVTLRVAQGTAALARGGSRP